MRCHPWYHLKLVVLTRYTKTTLLNNVRYFQRIDPLTLRQAKSVLFNLCTRLAKNTQLNLALSKKTRTNKSALWRPNWCLYASVNWWWNTLLSSFRSSVFLLVSRMNFVSSCHEFPYWLMKINRACKKSGIYCNVFFSDQYG